MSHYKDWRPHSLNIESMATDAQLTRIEAKLDMLLAKLDQAANSYVAKHQDGESLYAVPAKESR